MQQTGSENTQTHQVTTLIEQTPNSHNQFTRECVVSREMNCQSDLGRKEKTLPTEPLTSLRCYKQALLLNLHQWRLVLFNIRNVVIFFGSLQIEGTM